MKLEDQVCSLEIAKELKSLGVKQESLFWWTLRKDGIYHLLDFEKMIITTQLDSVSAYSVAELGEILKPYSILERNNNTYFLNLGFTEVCYMRGDKPTIEMIADTEANARGKMLIYLLKEGLIEGGGE